MNAIYVRVSTDEQARTGFSLQGQLNACRERLLSQGLTDIQEYIDDGYSGEFIERPALDRLRDDLRAKIIKVVVVYDPDRLSRNLTNQLLLADDIERAEAQLMFVTGDYDSSPQGKLFFSIRGAISAFEKAKIRERTMSGKRTKALSGKIVFNDKAFGYDYDKEASMYVINKKEADTVRLIYTMYIEKKIGTRQVSLDLKALGLHNKSGRPFTATNVYRILKNEMYAGTKWSFIYYDKKISQYKTQRTKRDIKDAIAIPVPAIVSKEIWSKAQGIMKTNTVFSKRNTKYEYLLSGVIKCGYCGYAMIARRNPRPNKDYFYYLCSSVPEKAKCDNKYINAEKFDLMVWDQLIHLAKNNVDFNSFNNKDAIDNSAIKEQLENHLLSLRKNQVAVLKWARDKILEEDAAEKELQLISKEIATVSSNLSSLQPKEEPTTINPFEILNATTFQQKRNIILKFKRISVKKVGDEIDWGFSV